MNTATVNDDLTVTVTIDGVEVDHPGPWGDREGAELWAAAILADLNNGIIHYPDYQQA